MGKGVTSERTGHILHQLFTVLAENPDGIQARDAIETTAGRMKLTEHEKGEYEKGGRRFDKILRFASIFTVNAGWMRKQNGIWTITDEGTKALKQYSADDFYRSATKKYRDRKKEQPEDEVILEEADQTTEANITLEEAEEQAWTEISTYLENIEPYRLQDLVAALLEAMGYHVSWIAPPGKDGGIDLLAWNDPLGTKPPRIKVQVKRRKDNIKVEEMRAFLSLINEEDVGLFVTTGGFTKEADNLVRSQERRKVTLIDSQRLVALWIEYNDKLEKDKRNLLPLKPIYFLAPGD